MLVNWWPGAGGGWAMSRAVMQQALNALELRAEYDDTFPSRTRALNDCAIASDALREELAKPDRGWMTMETAPTGAMILLANMNAMEARAWCFVGWMVDGRACGHRMDKPTHWMPLPKAPGAGL